MLDTQTVSTDLRSAWRHIHVPDKENGFPSQVTKRREVKRRGGSRGKEKRSSHGGARNGASSVIGGEGVLDGRIGTLDP